MDKLYLILFSLIALIGEAKGRIKVMSTLDDETVYILSERPIITNIDYPSKGMLLVARPIDACTPIIPSPDQLLNSSLELESSNNSTETASVGSSDFVWMLLVSWSPNDDDNADCSIRIKAENAVAAGYSVILFQDPADYDQEADAMSPLLAPLNPPSSTFEVGWTDANVYACTINPVDWDALRSNFSTDRYYLSFEDTNSMSGWFTYFIVGILVIGAVFFTIGLSYVLVQLLVIILIWIRESIVSRIQQIRRDRRRRLPASQLRKIPIQQWNSDMMQDTCSICLDLFDVTDRVRILPCSHVFHSACIDPWLLKQRRKCPNCKRKVVFPDENRDSDSSSDDERTPLLRRDSSVRESGSSATSPRIHGRTVHMCHPTVHVSRNVTNNNDNNVRSEIPNATPIPGNSSINPTSESGETNACPHHNIKEKVDQLCARVESVGRKIRKKAKANQASKLDDSSSDLSTSVQPVLVSVTVEPNYMPDSATDTDCSQPNNEESHRPQISNHVEHEPSTSCNSANNFGCINNLVGNSNNSDNDLQVKVVPDASPSHAINTSSEENHEVGESSILSDLNA